MKPILKNSIKIILPLLLGAGLLWYLYKGVNLEDMRTVLTSGVKWRWILLSLIFAVISHVLRGVLWKVQMKSLVDNPPTHKLVNSIFGTYGINLFLPRFGEVWRCSYVAREVKLPFPTVLGTMMAERMFDMLAVSLITVMAFVLERNQFMEYFSQHPTIASSFSGLLKSPVFILGGVALLSLLVVFRKKILHLKMFDKVREVIYKIWNGFKSVRQIKNKWLYVSLILLVWLMYFLNFYVCLFAFDFSSELDVFAALMLFVMGSIAVVVPVQGGIGPWHFAIISTMVLYGVGKTEASTFAFVVHTIQQLLVLLLGGYALVVIFIENKMKKKYKQDA